MTGKLWVCFLLASARLAQAAACGDERDTIIAEYVTYAVNLTPACGDFTQTAHSKYFSYAELSVNEPHSWSLLRQPLLIDPSAGYGLDSWREAYGSARTTTSVYRSPKKNSDVGGAAQSRHMYGDATDLANLSGGRSEWEAMQTAAGSAAADYIEPESGPCGLKCVHADWRSHSGPYTP